VSQTIPSDKHDPIKRWSTADVPCGKRLDYFVSAIDDALYPISLDRADPRTFRAEVSSAELGSIGVTKVASSPNINFRGKREIARTSDHRYILLMMLKGSLKVDHRGPLRMSPRDVLIIDSQHPRRVEVEQPFIAVNLVVSDQWLRQWLPNPNLLAARLIPGNSLWGLALSSYVSELSPDLVAAPPLPLSVLADQVGSLLALTASGLQSASFAYTPASRSLHERAQECLAQRCTELQLTAADVASSLDISVRTLHRVYAAAGETFGDKLIDAKADVALRMLTSSLFNRLTTAEIGRRAGFLSASHFARVIRARTGRTPLHLRRETNFAALDCESPDQDSEL
jgi:AraC-like DNA-binding protein